MKTGPWILMTLAAAGLSNAQERDVQKIIEVKYRNPERIARLVHMMHVDARADNEFHVIVVNGPAKDVGEYEEMVKKFDTPPPNVELTGYLVSASSREATDD